MNKFKNTLPPSASSNLSTRTRRASSMTTINPNFYEFSRMYPLLRKNPTGEEGGEETPMTANNSRGLAKVSINNASGGDDESNTSKKASANTSTTTSSSGTAVGSKVRSNNLDQQQELLRMQQQLLQHTRNNEGFQEQLYPTEQASHQAQQEQQDVPQFTETTNQYNQWYQQQVQNQKRNNLRVDENDMLRNSSQNSQSNSQSQTPLSIVLLLLQQRQQHNYQGNLIPAITSYINNSNMQILQNRMLLQQGHLSAQQQNHQLQQILAAGLSNQNEGRLPSHQLQQPPVAGHSQNQNSIPTHDQQNHELQQRIAGLLQQPSYPAHQSASPQLQQIIAGLLQQPSDPAHQSASPQIQQIVTEFLQNQLQQTIVGRGLSNQNDGHLPSYQQTHQLQQTIAAGLSQTQSSIPTHQQNNQLQQLGAGLVQHPSHPPHHSASPQGLLQQSLLSGPSSFPSNQGHQMMPVLEPQPSLPPLSLIQEESSANGSVEKGTQEQQPRSDLRTTDTYSTRRKDSNEDESGSNS